MGGNRQASVDFWSKEETVPLLLAFINVPLVKDKRSIFSQASLPFMIGRHGVSVAGLTVLLHCVVPLAGFPIYIVDRLQNP